MTCLSSLRPAKVAADRKTHREKLLTLVLKARNGLRLLYVADLLHSYIPARTLRSSDTPTRTVPNLKLKTIGDQFFCSVGPRLWLAVVSLCCARASENPRKVRYLVQH